MISNSSPFFIPYPSPWPFLFSTSLFNVFCIMLMWMEGMLGGSILMSMYTLQWGYVIFLWLSDVGWESGWEGNSSMEMDHSLKISMLWFIGSEVMFFFSFFFSYFALSSCTEVTSGGIWPPSIILLSSATSVPLLNTMILLSSGASLTWCHHMIISGNRQEAMLALLITLFLAFSFTLLQVFEYKESYFSLNDSFFGSIFYLATGFHGLHVILGSAMLLTSLKHMMNDNAISSGNHVLFEMSSWYWHFVDVVWLFLFLSLYCNLV